MRLVIDLINDCEYYDIVPGECDEDTFQQQPEPEDRDQEHDHVQHLPIVREKEDRKRAAFQDETARVLREAAERLQQKKRSAPSMAPIRCGQEGGCYREERKKLKTRRDKHEELMDHAVRFLTRK